MATTNSGMVNGAVSPEAGWVTRLSNRDSTGAE